MADPGLRIREISEIHELTEASALIDRIWGSSGVMSPHLMRALATHGSPLLGAFRDERLVGAQVGFLGLEDGRLIVHSHVTGVAQGEQRAGVGPAMKWAQRDWCLERGIDTVTWTFDPMVARNAYVNLHKLGARATRFLRAFYGEMRDGFNTGERSDRLEVRWELTDERVARAAAGTAPAAPVDGEAVVIEVPHDYQALRTSDPARARAARDRTADALESAFADGHVAVDFLREGAYVLRRP